ncbi:hypothetical protein HK097_008575 [Rhizophlyctis rosea]|uniref:TLC domain-containing protein n=1 Tax=Rhizophlyctis rosea TaxID=64517 RepID=A0AAD5SJV1_9FUNG|nr:hypothetical protein HK097_008575 [Rhizophlyctis rosea]
MTANTRSVQDVLASTDFILPFILSATSLTAAYITLPRLYPTTFSSEKSRAWLLSAISAITLTIGSIPFLLSHLQLGPASMARSPLVDSLLARSLCAFFIAFLICDLTIGVICYPKQIHPLSGWFHHTLYLVMVVGLLAAGVPGGFCTMGILELPTAVLALGSINKSWRNDMVFGGTFFATRIAIHAYFIQDLYFSFPGRGLWMVLAGVMPLHVIWFRGWILQQLRKKREGTKEEKEEKTVGNEKGAAVVNQSAAVLPLKDDVTEPMMVQMSPLEVIGAGGSKRRSPARNRRPIPKMRSGVSLQELNREGVGAQGLPPVGFA